MHDWHGIQIGIIFLFLVLPAFVGAGVGYVIAKKGNHRGGTRLRFVSLTAILGAAIGAAIAIGLFRY